MLNTNTTLPRILTYQGIPVWRHAQAIQWAAQIASGFLVVFLVAWFFFNIANAIEDREIPYGFSFLERASLIPIGQHFLPYDETSDTFLYAFGVAAVNTIVVSIVGVILATLLGIFVGVARLSGNWLVAKLALAYIEFFRNVPLLIQLYFWFYIVLALPPVREGYVIANSLFVNNAGISIPFAFPDGWTLALAWLAVAVAGIVAGTTAHRRLTDREIATGRTTYPVAVGIAAAIGIGLAAWLAISAVAGAPFVVSQPAPQGTFGRISGGFTMSGGLLALLIGLVMYTSSFIAEIVRAGIQSVGRGQIEAARALGLSPMGTLRQVTFPQALRVIIPPLISQFLNLTKNSSLAGAIGFADLTNVAKTMTQTAPAISIFILLMAAYLAMSLTYSLIGNLYNRRIRIAGG